MMDKDACIALLSRDPVRNMDMTEALLRGIGSIAYAAADAVLIRLNNGYQYALWAEDADAARRAIAGVADMPCCVSHSEDALSVVQAAYGHDYLSRCYQAAYLEKTPAAGAEGWDIRLLDASYAEFCASHYTLYNNPDEMREVLQKGDMLGAFVDGELAGFVGFHDDGSNGMLEVLPAYRRRGLGRALEAAVLNLALSRGFTPFGQVFTSNTVSIALQKAMGLTLSDEPIFWTLYLENRED